MDIGEAVRYLKSGHQLTRDGWNGAGQYLELQTRDEGSKMTLPYVFITTVAGEKVPWICSQTDLLADDWWMVDRETGMATDPSTTSMQDEPAGVGG